MEEFLKALEEASARLALVKGKLQGVKETLKMDLANARRLTLFKEPSYQEQKPTDNAPQNRG